MPAVYIDEFIVVNTALNYVLLYASKRILKNKASNIRIFISSLIGAFYAVLIFVPRAKAAVSAVGRIIFILILLAFTYKTKTLKMFLTAVSVFFAVCFVFGGCGYAVSNMLSPDRDIMFSVKVLVISTASAYAAISGASAVYKKLKVKSSFFTRVKINFNGKEIEVRGLIDTGNSLSDPLSGLPVIVVELEEIKGILPEAVYKPLREKNDMPLVFDAFGKAGMKTKFRMIPFASLGNSGGMIAGFKPDAVFVDGIETEAVIAVSGGSVSTDGSYFALVNPRAMSRCY